MVVEIYDIGKNMSRIPVLASAQLPNISKVMRQIDLDDARGDYGMKDKFLVKVKGFLGVRKAGRYQFRLLSDDGSRLRLDGCPRSRYGVSHHWHDSSCGSRQDF